MARWLSRIVGLGGLVALVACVEVAPRSSVAFHEAHARHLRYAAEVTLAIKEERRDAISVAAANGRLVRPQMPEVWGIREAAPSALDPPAPALAQPEPAPPGAPAPDLLLSAAVAPAAAPPGPLPASPYRFELSFGPNSAALDAAAERVVAGAVGSALMIRPVRVIVAGHADRAGGDAPGRGLSQRRAAAVIGALIRAGVPAELIERRAQGEQAPALPLGDASGHNRRVEIILV